MPNFLIAKEAVAIFSFRYSPFFLAFLLPEKFDHPVTCLVCTLTGWPLFCEPVKVPPAEDV